MPAPTAPDGARFDAIHVDPRIRVAMRILENEQQLVPNAADVAGRVGLSPAHFSRMFAAQLGEASGAYGRRIRLDHSVNRLRYDPTAIGQVAHDFGYESQAAFNRAFLQQFGFAPRDYMAKQSERRTPPPPLPGAVDMVRRQPTPLAARRFFGGDPSECWRTFLASLPPSLETGDRIALYYDDPLVTPEPHRRLDCCVVLGEGDWHSYMAALGLDPILLPGGLHGETVVQGDALALRGYFASLFGCWLPTRPTLAPEGDPLPIFFEGSPLEEPARARVAIRIRERGTEARFNAEAIEPPEKSAKSTELFRK